MRECKKFQDLILTDYIDNELDQKAQQEVEAHLVFCSECRLFAQKVKDKLSQPLREAQHEPVPDGLWPQIEEKIVKKPELFSGLAGFLDVLYSPFLYRRLMPVMAGVAIAFIAGSMVFYTHQLRIAKENEQGSYLVSLFEVPDSLEQGSEGTPANQIEEYFL